MKLFTREEPSRFALVDIRASEIAFAYAYRDSSGMAHVCYQSILPLDPHSEETSTETVVRVFTAACEALVTQGAPTLKNATGKGAADVITVQLTAPWQRTVLDRTVKQFGRSLVVTHALITKTVEEGRSSVPEEDLIEETVLSTMLNGYRVDQPVGKQAGSISCHVMRTYASSVLRTALTDTLRAHFHSTPHAFVAFESTAYRTVKKIAPYHCDYTILAMCSAATTIINYQGDALVATASIAQGTDLLLQDIQRQEITGGYLDESLSETERNALFSSRTEAAARTWEQSMFENMHRAIQPYSLVPTVFLISPNDTRDFIARTLQEVPLRNLWASNANVVITPLLIAAFSKQIQFNEITPELTIALLALRSNPS